MNLKYLKLMKNAFFCENAEKMNELVFIPVASYIFVWWISIPHAFMWPFLLGLLYGLWFQLPRQLFVKIANLALHLNHPEFLINLTIHYIWNFYCVAWVHKTFSHYQNFKAEEYIRRVMVLLLFVLGKCYHWEWVFVLCK